MIARWSTLWCGLAMLAPAGAQPVGKPDCPIARQQVVRALGEQGIHVAAKQVSMVTDVVASRPDAALQVLAVGPQTPTSTANNIVRSWIKFGCRTPGTCLPFYALVNLESKEGAARIALHRTEPGRVAPERNPILMRAGTHATLVLVGPQAHIELSVISLKGGAMGDTIRVATPDYRHFYRGQVAGAALLKGTF